MLRVGSRGVRLEGARLVLQPNEAFAQVVEIELGDLDLRLEQLETPVAQILYIGHGEIGLEQHAIATRALGFQSLLLCERGRALVEYGAFGFRDLAFLEADAHTLVVQDVAVEVGVLGRDLVPVMDDAIAVRPFI